MEAYSVFIHVYSKFLDPFHVLYQSTFLLLLADSLFNIHVQQSKNISNGGVKLVLNWYIQNHNYILNYILVDLNPSSALIEILKSTFCLLWMLKKINVNLHLFSVRKCNLYLLCIFPMKRFSVTLEI